MKPLILLIFVDFSFYVIWADFLIGKLILNSLFNAEAIHVLAPYYDQCFGGGRGGGNLVRFINKILGNFFFLV